MKRNLNYDLKRQSKKTIQSRNAVSSLQQTLNSKRFFKEKNHSSYSQRISAVFELIGRKSNLSAKPVTILWTIKHITI